MNIVWSATWCLFNILSCLIGLMALYIFCYVNILNSSWLWFVFQVLVHFLWAVFIRLWYRIKRFDSFCYQRHRNIWQSWSTQSASYFFNCMVVQVVVAYIYTTWKMLLPYVLFEFCLKLLGLWLTDISFVWKQWTFETSFCFLLFPLHKLFCIPTGEMSIVMEITIELFMYGFLLKILKNCFSSDVLTAKIHGQGCGISLVLVIYLLVIHRL